MLDGRDTEELSDAECRRLLATTDVGWLAFCVEGEPHLAPVNYVVSADEIVVRSRYGTRLAAAAQEAAMALGASVLDPATRTGWSVEVRGRARLLGDAIVNPEVPEVRTWAAGTRVRFAVPMESLAGRRLVEPGS